jgi:hypothetical protein
MKKELNGVWFNLHHLTLGLSVPLDPMTHRQATIKNEKQRDHLRGNLSNADQVEMSNSY